eukprot:snap_masked-scaffold_24-processed-gene-2.36-mRNA-1 protein AED:1.00 eAED:1.00 QI:0/0/0/0/1/1/3/0/657
MENNLRSARFLRALLKEVSKMRSLMSVFIQEENNEEEKEEIFSLIKACLSGLKGLQKFILRIGEINLNEEEINEIQDLIENHVLLVLFEISDKKKISKKVLEKKLKLYFNRKLECEYNKYRVLNECQVLFMGDGRVGKTSTIRSLFNRRFQLYNESTLVLNDIDVFSVNPNNYKWTSLSKYALSIQRVKNSLPRIIHTGFESDKQVQNKYKLNFQEELLCRAVADHKFVEKMKTSFSTFGTQEIYFRVYDFGGQDIFSSVHHLFMHSNALYFLVFNMTKLKRKDLDRMKFWCESILRNAPKAKVMLIGTYLNRYKRKNTEDADLVLLNEKILSILENFSSNISVLENESIMFFPIENSAEKDSWQIKEIKKHVIKVVSGEADVIKEGFLNFEAITAHILFLDNCREQSSLITLKKFEEKATSCGFEIFEIEEMLDTFSTAGLISYFPNLDLTEEENFIFFAPSYVAQALGEFIRDPSFHELAFRMSSDKFSLYRKYVDSGKLSKELFEILLKNYTDHEKKYVLQLALETLVLIPVDENNDTFILPELLPSVDGSRIKPSESSTIDIVFDNPFRLSIFVKIVIIFQKEKEIQESFIFKGFARLILDTRRVVDTFIKDDKTIGFNMVQSSDVAWLEEVAHQLSTEIKALEENFTVQNVS